MILEAIVSTLSANGELNIAPMGPHFEPGLDHFELRPFDTSTTFRNLQENPCGVLHITDDVLLIARAALDCLVAVPETDSADRINGRVLTDCCRWHEFTAVPKPADSPRKTFHCQIVKSGRKRDFVGFNRAKHAVIEATISASRIDFIPIAEIEEQLHKLKTIVEKTGGPLEMEAFAVVAGFVHQQISS